MSTTPGYYVYVHRRPEDRSVFYVGKGSARRAWSRTGRNRWWRHVVQRHGCEVEIVRAGLSEPCALSLERALICVIGREALVNLVDGGGGISGWKHSPETKAKISAFNKGKTPTPKALAALRGRDGKKLTDEHRGKLSAAKKGLPRPPPSPETRAKISAAHMGLRPTQETLRKMSSAKIGMRLGRDSPTYDHAMRRFAHPEHGVFDGTRGDFILKYGLSNGSVSAVIAGKEKSVKGWRIA